MRNILLLTSALLLCVNLTKAQTPNFDYPCLIPTPGAYVVTNNNFAVPCVGDWDDDNDLDLMVGVMYEGYVIYYENVATGSLPIYAEGDSIEADGEVISVTYA